VLLPGMLCDDELWWHQLEHLGDLTDTSVGDVTRDDSIAAMAQRVLAQAPERFTLAGLSLGGIVALEIVRQEPQRVEALALVDTNARPPRPEQRDLWRTQTQMVERGRFDELVEHEWVPSIAGASEAVAETASRMARRVGPEAFVRQLAAQAGRGDRRPVLRGISCRTLVLAGRQDALCPPELQEEIAGAISGAALVFIEDCGHLSSLERPQAVTAVLRYWLSDS